MPKRVATARDFWARNRVSTTQRGDRRRRISQTWRVTFRLLTWNLNGLDDQRLDERTEDAVFIAVTGLTLAQLARGGTTRAAPDVLMFQEVTRHTYKAHLRTHLPRAGYTLYPARPPESETCEIIAVRQPATMSQARSVPLDRSIYGRNLHVVEAARTAGSEVRIRLLTAHFDSGTDESEVRIAEARQTIAEMDDHSVFAGDTNLPSGMPSPSGQRSPTLGRNSAARPTFAIRGKCTATTPGSTASGSATPYTSCRWKPSDRSAQAECHRPITSVC
jgi:hypothetical protein